MRTWIRASIFALTLISPVVTEAAQPKCPLDPEKCLEAFERMKHRPWLGIRFEPDSTGRIVVQGTVPGSPAQLAGVRAGDVLRAIDGKAPAEWFAGKVGWGPNEKGRITVERGRRERQLSVAYEGIPEDVFARIVGEHMVEAHLAYMTHGDGDEHESK